MKRSDFAMVAVLVLAVWAVYSNALEGPFEFDDWHVINQNPGIHSLSKIPGYFTGISDFSILPGNRDYRPVFLISMALAWKAGGGSTLPFHLTSVSLHVVNVVVVFMILRLLAAPGARPPERGSGAAGFVGAGFVGALLFAVHPAATEAVNYISSQSILWAACFYLLALLLFVALWHRAPRRPVRGLWAQSAGSWVCYALALLSKPIAITLPVVLLLWEVVFGGLFARDGGSRGGWRRGAKHVPYWILTVAYLWVRRLVFPPPGEPGSPVRERLVHYLTETKALVFYYLRMAVAPGSLSVDREYPVSTSIWDPAVLAALVIAVVIAGLLLWKRRQRNVVFWTLWFPICLFITTYGAVLGQVVRVGRVYLSLIGVCALAGILVAAVWRRFPLRLSDLEIGPRVGRLALAGFVVAVVSGFAARTHAQNRIWSESLLLWENAALGEGTWRAHMNYALALEDVGRGEDALAEFRRAVELGPYSFAHLNLGLAYVRRGQTDLGLEHLQEAVRLWPTSPEAHYYLGRGLESALDRPGAESEYREALRLRPDYILAHERLASLLEVDGRFEEALTTYRRLVEITPEAENARAKVAELESGDFVVSTDALFERAFAAQQAGHRDDALSLYERLLDADPEHRQGTFNLAYAYRDGETGAEWERSAELFARVLEIDPEYSEAHFHRATTLRRLGRADEADRADRRYLETGEHRDLLEAARRRLGGVEDGGAV